MYTVINSFIEKYRSVWFQKSRYLLHIKKKYIHLFLSLTFMFFWFMNDKTFHIPLQYIFFSFLIISEITYQYFYQ